MSSWKTQECSICEESLDENDKQVTTECGHTFHRTCARERVDNKNRTDCHVCHIESALGKALHHIKASKATGQSSYSSKKEQDNAGSGGYGASVSKARATHVKGENGNDWQCEHCSATNKLSTRRCTSCGEPRIAVSSTSDAATRAAAIDVKEKDFHASPPIKDKKDHPYKYSESEAKAHHADGSSPLSTPDYTSDPYYRSSSGAMPTPYKKKSKPEEAIDPESEAVVYITDLPSDIHDSLELERLIRHRIENLFQIIPTAIKCYPTLGFGVIHVSNDKIKDRLVNDIENLSLNTKKGTTLISFGSSLELVSYIVVGMTKEEKDAGFLTAEDVSRRWTQLHNGEKLSLCEQVNVEFQNIYRIVSTSLDGFLDANSTQDFKIKNQFAQVYFCADCSFFENLPKSTTEDQLRQAIGAAIGQANLSSSSLYIQLNKQANNACIIATGTARKWSTKSFLYLADKPIPKKENLACRLYVHPVPRTVAVETIVNHQIFAGKATISKHKGENLILELSDTDIFHECVKRGALRVGDKHLLHMEIYTASSNPEENEIDVDTWYEGDMLQLKPDIMQFIADPEHKIFQYKWNAKIWLEQFNRSATANRVASSNINLRDRKGTTGDQVRHRLRVTAMLNTIAAVRKKSYMIGDREVKLNLDKKLKTIIYNHQSILEQGKKASLVRIPFKETRIKIVNDDCLVVYENLVKKGKKPLLLNMANATSPGGGYRKGDGAQEENVFRRSDYFRSLDVGLDEIQEKPPQRFHCSSHCDLDSSFDPDNMYPMDEFGAIYTLDLTVFRQPEETGYAYMEEPLNGVCSLAMAAYRDPKLDGNMLASKYAVGTRKKIENIFAIAHKHEHDSLVLSALGCGAFKNPPEHVAKLFRSVIEQYAGFFELITFAIIDDHNAGHQLNPKGNVKPFKEELDGLVVQPITSMKQPDTMIGPYRVLSNGSNVRSVHICDLTPCHFGAKCKDMFDSKHADQFSHPPLCAHASVTGTCPRTSDIVHMSSFIHRSPCKFGTECKEIDDKKHAQQFEHPSYCPAGGDCQDMSEKHMQAYRHLPLCKYAQKCMEYLKHAKAHCDVFRHCTPHCTHGSYCVNFHNTKHIDEYAHPFPQPCPFTPYNCALHSELTQASDTRKLSQEVQQHCLNYAHVCRFGRSCRDKFPLHWEKSIHVPRSLCPFDDKCTKLLQEDHLNSFTHSNISDIRRLCKHADECHDRQELEHIEKFRHVLKFEDSGVVRYYNLNKDTNFVQNQKDNIARVESYVQSEKWKPLPSKSISQEIIDWIRTVQPVHRCVPEIFESILLHGHVMSREYMEHLKKPKFVANSVLQHSRIQRISALRVKTYAEHAREYITALVTEEYEKAGFLGDIPPPSSDDHSSENRGQLLKRKQGLLLGVIHSKDMEAIRTKAVEIAAASIKLHSNPAGIGYAPDAKLGTNKNVFSIIGPHLGFYYGDVVIVFKREILHHPDANFSVQAATSYASGKAYHWRPWLGTDSGSEDERIKLYHASKLHASVPGYEYAAALELIAVTSQRLHKKTMHVDLSTILERWLKVDSHETIEGHLPQLIPLDYIDHIYMTQTIYDALNADTHRAIKAVFGHRHTITPHKNTDEYNKFIVQELIKRFGQRDTNSISRPIRGTVITIPSTNFTDHLVLPLTISQSYAQHRIDHPKPSKDSTTYIYWQAMNGDMMLTLSNEQIDPGEDQPNLHCLICYVAEKPKTSDTHYYEHASYLNSGRPFLHDIFVSKGKFADKSTEFYVGCNTDDFMTFCLEIQRSTGMVTLSHAGPNSIYNHETISHTFSKSEIDMTKMEYIHVSAGAHTVPIRNLIVCFDKQADLHPTFDKEFKKGSSFSATPPTPDDAHAKKGHGDHHASLPRADDNKEKEPSGILTKAKNFFFGGQRKPCPDNVNCLIQFSDDGADHNSKYSHPCRFSELCKDQEPHLTHEPHEVPQCNQDKNCNHLSNPIHRAKYRHTGYPDFLIPCRDQNKCKDKSDKHRIKFSHSDQVLDTVETKVSKGQNYYPSQHEQKHNKQDHGYDQRTPCKWGSECREIEDHGHCNKYSHPSAAKKKDDHRIPCQWGIQCHEHSSDHRAKYSHPSQDGGHQNKGTHRIPCKWGTQCHDHNSDHRATFSHPKS